MIFATQEGFGNFQPATGRVDRYSSAGDHRGTVHVGIGPPPNVIGERDEKLLIYGDHSGHDPATALVFRELPDMELVVPFMNGGGLYLGCEDAVAVLDGRGRILDDVVFSGAEIVPTKWPSGYWIRRSFEDDDDHTVLMHELDELGARILPRFHRAWHSHGHFLGLQGRAALWQFAADSPHALQRRFPKECYQIMDVGCNAGGCSAIAIRGDELVGLLAHGDGDFAQAFAVPYWHEFIVVGEGTHAVFSDGRIFEFASDSWLRWSDGVL